MGHTNQRGVLVDLSGQLIASHFLPHDLSIPHAGWAEHDPERVWWGDFCKISQTLLEKGAINPADICAIAPGAIGPDVLPDDNTCHPLRAGILYGIDTRATNEIIQIEQAIGKDELVRLCGNGLSSISFPSHILLDRCSGDQWIFDSLVSRKTRTRPGNTGSPRG